MRYSEKLSTTAKALAGIIANEILVEILQKKRVAAEWETVESITE
jgi:hypothetical protein